MIDLSEELIPLCEIPKQPFVPRRRAGKKMCIATAYRWAGIGINGIRLETIKCGGTLCTTKTAILEFFQRLSAPRIPANVVLPSEPAPAIRTALQRQRDSERAGRELEAAGI
jgi:hypothetical protein